MAKTQEMRRLCGILKAHHFGSWGIGAVPDMFDDLLRTDVQQRQDTEDEVASIGS